MNVCDSREYRLAMSELDEAAAARAVELAHRHRDVLAGVALCKRYPGVRRVWPSCGAAVTAILRHNRIERPPGVIVGGVWRIAAVEIMQCCVAAFSASFGDRFASDHAVSLEHCATLYGTSVADARAFVIEWQGLIGPLGK